MIAADALVLDGRFRIVQRLGGGGMGDVYLAEQVSLGRKVAVKVLKAEFGLQSSMEKRFRREAQLLSSVDHPAVVRVIDFGNHDGSPCLVMELAEGQTLQEALAKGPLPLTRALPLLAQLADGLTAIHAQGIVHRDLKPENVVLSQTTRGEQARLLDFGIAKLAEGPKDSNVSQIGVILGTPEYLSPEQAMGANLDARSDLYSFGVLAYRTLSGRLPFVGPSPRQFLAQHLAAPPIPLAEAAPHLARMPALCEVVMRALGKDPASRPANADALARALAAAALELPRPAEGAPAPTSTPELLPYEAPPPRSGTAAFAAPSSATAAFGAASPPPVQSPGVQLVPARTTSAFPMGNARQQNLTLMLTDIVGFTARTSRQTREENARMLEEHDQLLLPVFKAHGGRVLQKRGDSFLVGFGSPTESVLCGMELQDRLWRRNKLIGKKDPLEVRVAIHLGEILLTRDGPMGEPVQILAAVEEAALANEVVFTEAVNLAMIRAEVRAEPRGEVAVPGRQDRLSLYRCAPAAEGPPFGGRDLSGKAARPKKALRNLGGLLHHPPGRTALALGVVALIAAAVAVPVVLNSTPRQIRAALESGDAEGALALLEAAPKEQRASLLPLKVAALHAAGRHREELAAARTLEKDVLNRLEGPALKGLSEDFARDDDAALKKLLGQVDAGQLADLVATSEAPDTSGWGALRYLDGAKALPAERLAQGFIAALAATDCPVRAHAARRLGELKSPQAAEALERLAKQPKQKDPVLRVIDQNCGQDEAAQALRSLGRSAQR